MVPPLLSPNNTASCTSSSGVNGPLTASQYVGFVPAGRVGVGAGEDVSVVVSVVSVVSVVLVLSEAVVSSVVDVSDDSPTVAVVSELPILVELEVSDRVIVVTTADMVTSVVDPPPVTVTVVAGTDSSTEVDSNLSMTSVPDLVRETVAVLL